LHRCSKSKLRKFKAVLVGFVGGFKYIQYNKYKQNKPTKCEGGNQQTGIHTKKTTQLNRFVSMDGSADWSRSVDVQDDVPCPLLPLRPLGPHHDPAVLWVTKASSSWAAGDLRAPLGGVRKEYGRTVGEYSPKLREEKACGVPPSELKKKHGRGANTQSPKFV